MENTERLRTWAEVNLDAIEFNYHSLKSLLNENTKFLGIVKADAYGHGAIPVASRLEKCGCDYFAVATYIEAVELRKGGITTPVLILGYTPPEAADTLLEYNITQCVPSLDYARSLSTAIETGSRLKVHLKVDSGMGRLGFICSKGRDPVEEMAEILCLPGLIAEGIFTHLAVADSKDDEYTRGQFESFIDLVERLEKIAGHKFSISHCANSAATLKFPSMQLDMVRPGVATYGIYPQAGVCPVLLKPTLSLKTRVVQLKRNEAGDSISYGGIYIAPDARKIAVLPIGYADGLHRILSGKIDVLVRGRRVPQVGRICMDMCMADVTNVPDVQVGDEVTFIGSDGNETLSADLMAEKAQTIPYEIFCSLSKRVPRVYI